MKWLKGITLLLIANVLIFVTLSITFTLLVNVILPAFGIDVRGAVNQEDLVWAMVIGFGGAFLSLAFSKQMARSMLDCYQITQPRTPAEQVVYGAGEFARLAPPPLPVTPNWSPVATYGGYARPAAHTASRGPAHARASSTLSAVAGVRAKTRQWVRGVSGLWEFGCDCFAF